MTRHANGYSYQTFRVEGSLRGVRVRRQFKNRNAALAEKNRLDVLAANSAEMEARATRLTADQLAQAEAAFVRLGARPLAFAIEWFLANYRPPLLPIALNDAVAAFESDRERHVRPITLRDYKLTLSKLQETMGARRVHEVRTEDILAFVESQKVGPKRWNNLRSDLHSFFQFACAAPRRWATSNPVADIPKFKIARRLPQIETAGAIRELFAFLETYRGEYGTLQSPGFLVPYFALATFAGLRPSVVEGEIYKIGAVKNPERIIDVDLGVIRLGPEIAKTKDIRQVTIQTNLAAWLKRYPISKYPLRVPNLKFHVTSARARCGLAGKDDILRHTFISMHVAKFKSLGQIALEAGNSERIIKKHYFNLVSTADAEAFWTIEPTR